jgi:hypothetical protein
MEVGQLHDYIGNLEEQLAAKIQQQREYFEGQLAVLQIYASNKAAAAVRAVTRERCGAPKPSPSISRRKTGASSGPAGACFPCGCGKEIKGTKLTKDNFLIK